MSIINILTLVVVLLYVFGAISVLSKLFHQQGPNPKVYLTLGTLAVLAHSFLLSQSIFIDTRIDFNLLNVISIMAFIICGSVTLLAIKYRASLVIPVVYGFSALLVALSSIAPNSEHIVIEAGKLSLVVHISFALMSYAILFIATLYAFQVNFIHKKLKSKNIAAVNHLPPLMQVESQLFLILCAGTICLVISQAVGMIFIDEFLSKSYAHKTILSLIALFIYITMIWGHYQRGWRGNRILTLSVVATFLLTLSYFGSKFVKEFLLS